MPRFAGAVVVAPAGSESSCRRNCSTCARVGAFLCATDHPSPSTSILPSSLFPSAASERRQGQAVRSVSVDHTPREPFVLEVLLNRVNDVSGGNHIEAFGDYGAG